MTPILEVHPAADGFAPFTRVSTAPRDLASTVMLLLYCSLMTSAVCVALAAALVAGMFHARHHTCLLSYMPNGNNLCYFTFVAAFFTLPLAVGIMVTELLPARRVSPGVKNFVPLGLTIIGMALWGVEAAAIHERDAQHRPVEGRWRHPLEQLAWCAFSLFVITCIVKLLSPLLEPTIDSTSLCLGRVCPEGFLPACDACCCLDVRTAKVPREVLRQGQVTVRFMTWNQEICSNNVLPELVLPGVPGVHTPMTRR